jgi:DNA-binding PadR family transcriptional regulator
MFRLLPRGFSNRDLRDTVAPLLGKRPTDLTPGQMTYQLRRLRLRGLIRRLPRTHRYQVTEEGLRAALFFTTSASMVLHPIGAASYGSPLPDSPSISQILKHLHKTFAALPELHNAT